MFPVAVFSGAAGLLGEAFDATALRVVCATFSLITLLLWCFVAACTLRHLLWEGALWGGGGRQSMEKRQQEQEEEEAEEGRCGEEDEENKEEALAAEEGAAAAMLGGEEEEDSSFHRRQLQPRHSRPKQQQQQQHQQQQSQAQLPEGVRSLFVAPSLRPRSQGLQLSGRRGGAAGEARRSRQALLAQLSKASDVQHYASLGLTEAGSE